MRLLSAVALYIRQYCTVARIIMRVPAAIFAETDKPSGKVSSKAVELSHV